MTLLCAPIILSTIGLWISNGINKQQRNFSVISDRLKISNDYFNEMSNLILSTDFMRMTARHREEAREAGGRSAIQSKEEIAEYCDPDRNNPLTSIGYTRTITVLRSLTELTTTEETHTPIKRGILHMLYYSGLINRKGHVISLQQAQLTEADLSNIYLGNSCFDSVDFSSSNLVKTNMENSNLVRAAFLNARLRKAKLGGSNLVATNFSNASMEESVLERSDIRDAKLDGAVLVASQLSNTDLRGASLVGTNLQRANLSRADLRGTDLSGADLRGANMKAAKIGPTTKLIGACFNTKAINNSSQIKTQHEWQKRLGLLDRLFQVDRLMGEKVEISSGTVFPDKFDPHTKRMQESNGVTCKTFQKATLTE